MNASWHFFTGPFRPTASGALELNPAAWQSEANMLFVEQPVGVGFSYSDNVDDYSTGNVDGGTCIYTL
jgi:carboxypeptidase C (cathepsin A)